MYCISLFSTILSIISDYNLFISLYLKQTIIHFCTYFILISMAKNNRKSTRKISTRATAKSAMNAPNSDDSHTNIDQNVNTTMQTNNMITTQPNQMTEISNNPVNNYNSSNFSVSIQNFDGNPNYLSFFIQQILDLKNINKWSEDKTIIFIRSKLSGQALEFYINNPTVNSIKSVDELFKQFKTYFEHESFSNPILELDKLKINLNESLLAFSLRIDNLVNKLYSNMSITDQDNIKYNKLISNLPEDIRLFILQNQITNNREALNKAIFLQNVNRQNKQFSSTTHDPDNNDKLSQLTAQINVLQTKLQKLENPPTCAQSVNESANEYSNHSINFINLYESGGSYAVPAESLAQMSVLVQQLYHVILFPSQNVSKQVQPRFPFVGLSVIGD